MYYEVFPLWRYSWPCVRSRDFLLYFSSDSFLGLFLGSCLTCLCWLAEDLGERGAHCRSLQFLVWLLCSSTLPVNFSYFGFVTSLAHGDPWAEYGSCVLAILHTVNWDSPRSYFVCFTSFPQGPLSCATCCPLSELLVSYILPCFLKWWVYLEWKSQFSF